MSKAKSPPTMTIITDISQVPAFTTEAEEHEFWSAHAFAEHLLGRDNTDPDFALPEEQSTARPDARSRSTSIRLGSDLERRLRHLAKLKGTSYQTLLKQFVLERIYEEEKRHKVI